MLEQQAIARMNGGHQGIQGHLMQGVGGNVMGTPTSAQRPGISSMSPAPNQQISRPRKIILSLHDFFFFVSCAKFATIFVYFLLLLLSTIDTFFNKFPNF